MCKLRTLARVVAFSGVVLLLAVFGAITLRGEVAGPVNLALRARGATAQSWETGAAVVPGHEAGKANDGSLKSYWAVRSSDLPADLGIEWPEPQTISSLVIRYYDGRMVRGPAVARTQEGVLLQYWVQSAWRDVETEPIGEETSTVRYVFAPVTTTRLRVLFTEPPDPEFRRSPDRLGVYVCELEAYRDVPFQVVRAPGRVVRIQRHHARTYLDHYNEPPTGDADYNIPGPLVIEPKQMRIFADRLTPTLIVSETRRAQEAPTATTIPAGGARLRNGFLQLDLATTEHLKETQLVNRVTEETVSTPLSVAFLLRTSQGDFTPAQFKLLRADPSTSDPDAARLGVFLTSEKLDVVVHYELRRQDHFLHKWLDITNKTATDLVVRDLTVSSLGLPHPVDLMAGQELTYPITRLRRGGFFSCLETVYWDHRGDALTYYPGATLPAGKTLESEKAVVGIYQNYGDVVMGWDRGLRDWVTEYHVHISPAPEEWPDVYCEGWSAKVGLKEFLERPQWTEQIMATAQKLGIRYMDGYEATHQMTEEPSEWLRGFVDLASRFNVNTGWWIDFGSDISWATGTPIKPLACWLSPEGEAYFRKMADFARSYHFRAMHWADFFEVFPCERADHGHLPGKYSIYAQGQRMLHFGEQLRAASPGIMLGADGGFTNPQYVRYEDSRAHGTYYGGYEGDHFAAVEPDIHLDRLYGDMNRVYEFGSHSIYLRPWHRMLNCVNHYGQESELHDRPGFRYSLLSALAMAGQVTFNAVPEDIPNSEIAFARTWLSWAKAHKDYLKEGVKLFDRTAHFADIWQGDAESLSGFAHIRKDRGYVFLLNPTPVEQVAELALALDASESTKFVAEEVFPGGMTLEGPLDGEYPQGGKLRVTVPAKQVRIIWISPASASPARQNLMPEDARVVPWRRYVAEWNIARKTPEAATLRSSFQYPKGGEAYLAANEPESAWAREPWAYDKAYLVFLLKDETQEQNDNWVADRLEVAGQEGNESATSVPSVLVNGVSKTLYAFKTLRNQRPGLTRCYFVELKGEVKPDQPNDVEITLPIRTGLLFSGAYVDLPDQMPTGQ
jgi:hypothetical protein